MLRFLEYKHKTSVLHALDPRTKIYLSGSFIASTLLTNNLTLLLVICVALLSIIWLANVLKDVLKELKGFTYFVVLIFLIDSMLFSLGFALIMTAKFIAIIFSFLFLFATTPPDELIQVMEALRLPVEVIISFSIALRYIPTMIREAELILDSQRSRGVSFHEGNFIKKLKGYTYLLVPLITLSTRKAIQMAESMESRGFGAKNKRTNLKELKMKKNDYLVAIIPTLMLITMFLFEFYFVMPSWITINIFIR